MLDKSIERRFIAVENNQQEMAVFNLSEAAKYAGVSLPTITAWVNRSGFPAFKSGRRWIIPRDSFVDWMRKQAESRARL